MKYVVLCVLGWLVSLSGAAQEADLPPYITRIDGSDNKEAIPLDIAAYGLIATFITRDKQQPGEGIRLVSRLFDVEPDAAAEFVADAKSAHQVYSDALATAARSICEKHITTREEYAAAMAANEKAYEDLKSDFVDRLGSNSDPTLWARIMRRADDARASTSIVVTDYLALTETQPYGPLLARSRAPCSD